MPLTDTILQMVGLRPKQFRDRLPPASPATLSRFEDRTGPAFAYERQLARRQAEEDAAYERWVQQREMIGGLIKALGGPNAVLRDPPPE